MFFSMPSLHREYYHTLWLILYILMNACMHAITVERTWEDGVRINNFLWNTVQTFFEKSKQFIRTYRITYNKYTQRHNSQPIPLVSAFAPIIIFQTNLFFCLLNYHNDSSTIPVAFIVKFWSTGMEMISELCRFMYYEKRDSEWLQRFDLELDAFWSVTSIRWGRSMC